MPSRRRKKITEIYKDIETYTGPKLEVRFDHIERPPNSDRSVVIVSYYCPGCDTRNLVDFRVLKRSKTALCKACSATENAKLASIGCSISQRNKAGEIVSSKPSLSNLVYIDKRAYVDSICPTCNVTTQRSLKSVKKYGAVCQNCSRRSYYLDEPTVLYYIKFTVGSTTYYKIGITLERYGIVERYRGDLTPEILYEITFPNGKIAWEVEQRILYHYRYFRCQDVNILRGGNTELFYSDVLNLDNIGRL